MGFGASEYHLPSGEFAYWGFLLLTSISAVDELSIGYVMRCGIMDRRVWDYPWSTLGEKQSGRLVEVQVAAERAEHHGIGTESVKIKRGSLSLPSLYFPGDS